MKRMMLGAALAILPGALAAQVSVGGGAGFTGSDDLSGNALHVQAGVSLVQVAPGFRLGVEGLYQRGRAEGSPLSCEATSHCLGREDRNRILGAGLVVRRDLNELRGVQWYIPVGLGMYHRRTATTEWQGPTAFCPGSADADACPNPPFGENQLTESQLSLGYSFGIGAEVPLGSGRVFTELRAHDLLEARSGAGAVPLTVGFRF